MKNVAAVSALAIASLASYVTAAPLQARDGPSGTVVAPTGGTVVRNDQRFQNSTLGIEYDCISRIKPDTATTLGIKVSLQQGDNTYVLTDASACDPDSLKVAGQWLLPKDACGDARLVFEERQNYLGEVITFQSAAPEVQIDCVGSS